MKRLGHLIESIANIGGYFSGWLVPVMIALIFVEVFMRYVLNRPPAVADEFSAYMLVALSVLGVAYTWRQKGHVRITALVSRLSPKAASWLRLITLVFVFLFVLGLFQGSYEFMASSFKLHRASSTWFHTPLQGPHMTMAIGFAIFLLVLIVDIARAIVNIKAGKSAEEASR
ncbi:TRAP transporter small permease subunit [Chloroflexota bacterium]